MLNEIFNSTTLEDQVLLSTRVLEQIMRIGALCVCVTFIDELASLGESTVSMVSTVVPDRPAERTFKVVRRPADGLAYAMSLADKHGVTYARLQERLRVMKAHLLYRDRDFDPGVGPAARRPTAWSQDLELDVLFDAMAGKDRFFRDVARSAMLSAAGTDAGTVLYRQDVLRDCLEQRETVRRDLRAERRGAGEGTKELLRGARQYPSSILYRSVEVLKMFAEMLRRLRGIRRPRGARLPLRGLPQLLRHARAASSTTPTSTRSHRI